MIKNLETRKNLCSFFYTNDHHYLLRFTWPYSLYYATKAKRNKCAPGVRCNYFANGYFGYKKLSIAFPVAAYFMNRWLNIFPYNTGLSVIPFIVSAFLILITATATASYHSAKAALSSSGKILKTE